MQKNRLEAFSDGVLAIVITIMVLELKAPESTQWTALRKLAPIFLSYVLSFIYVGIYWNNHHHLLHTVKRVSAPMLWANLHLLFWLSMFPFATAWAGEHHDAPAPSALYGFVLLMAAIAYYILQLTIVSKQGRDATLAKALGRDWKGKLSPVVYLIAIPMSYVNVWAADMLYVLIAMVWVIPDRRIERQLSEE